MIWTRWKSRRGMIRLMSSTRSLPDSSSQPVREAVSRDPDAAEIWDARRPIRRLFGLMLGYGLIGAICAWFFAGFEAAAILTGSVAVSIVNFRGLEAQTRILAPTSDGKLGLFRRVLILLRITLVILLIVLALRTFPGQHVAVLVGLGSLPFALLGETLIQSTAFLREGSHGRRR